MLCDIELKRKLSCNYYKRKRMLLAQMTFGKLPLTTERGDIYPYLFCDGEPCDLCVDNKFRFEPNGERRACARLIGSFNPYSTYDIAICDMGDGCEVGVLV